jgi:DNA-binding NarL/FixJ family response regulator
MIRVLIADDHGVVRDGLGRLIEALPDMEVVGLAADGEQAVARSAEAQPDVVLMDLEMPGIDGIEATRQIAGDPDLADVHVVILTNHGFDEYVLDALRAGAAGFLVKDIEPDDLLHGVRVAARGDALLSPSVTRTLIDRFVTQPLLPTAGTGLSELTTREREAVALVAHGLSNDQVADRMVITPLTAKTHVNRAMVKLHVRDRAQLVVLAYECGLVVPGGASTRADRPTTEGWAQSSRDGATRPQ